MEIHELNIGPDTSLGENELKISEIDKISISTPVYTAKTFKHRELNNIRLVGADKPLHL